MNNWEVDSVRILKGNTAFDSFGSQLSNSFACLILSEHVHSGVMFIIYLRQMHIQFSLGVVVSKTIVRPQTIYSIL